MLKRLFYPFLLLIAIFSVAELTSYQLGHWLQRKQLIHTPQTPTAKILVKDYADYLEKRDPILGWLYPFQRGGNFFDESGARRLPAFDSPNKFSNCLSLYGDSYVMGSDVNHEAAWANQLAKQLGCRVANYGVGGYGIDQSYLRFQSHHNDSAKWVILGHSSIDIIRNINRLSDLYATGQSFAFKPRFILDAQQQLQFIPMPKLSEEEYLRVIGLKQPILQLEHEHFQFDGAAGITRFQFPYTYTLLKSLRDFRMKARLAGTSPYLEFYQPRHPTQSLELATALLQKFYQTALQRQQQPILIFFANDSDMRFYRKTQQWSYQNLLNALDKLQIPYLNFGPTLATHIGQRPSDDFFSNGHYNEQVNQWVAEFLQAYLRDKVIIPPPPLLEK